MLHAACSICKQPDEICAFSPMYTETGKFLDVCQSMGYK